MTHISYICRVFSYKTLIMNQQARIRSSDKTGSNRFSTPVIGHVTGRKPPEFQPTISARQAVQMKNAFSPSRSPDQSRRGLCSCRRMRLIDDTHRRSQPGTSGLLACCRLTRRHGPAGLLTPRSSDVAISPRRRRWRSTDWAAVRSAKLHTYAKPCCDGKIPTQPG